MLFNSTFQRQVCEPDDGGATLDLGLAAKEGITKTSAGS
jgi:hypothetical protein